jgi:hypothetical protein
MNYLGMNISVVGPVKITRTKLVEVKSKVGPRRVRKQKIKVLDGWQEVLEDGQVLNFVQTNTFQMNAATYAELMKSVEADQRIETGMPRGLLGAAMRGAY